MPTPASQSPLPGPDYCAANRASAPIWWQCSVCDDEGVISNWEDSEVDLRPRWLALAEAVSEVVLPNDVAAALRSLRFLETDCERLVFRIRAHNDHAATQGHISAVAAPSSLTGQGQAHRRVLAQ